MTTTTYRVPSMHCASCPKLITLALEDLDGVSVVDAQLDSKIVTVTYDEAVATRDVVDAAIRDAGYEPELADEPESPVA